MEFNYCYIFDYCVSKLYCINLNKVSKQLKGNEDLEELIKSYGININTCQYMLTDEELTIEYIN